jgi:TonB family protein
MSTQSNRPAEPRQPSCESSLPSPTALVPESGAPEGSPSPVCVAIPVRVHGVQNCAPAGEGTACTESFTEDTETLVLFPSGAVVRLAAAVRQGQEVILTNLNSQHHVHCQVISVGVGESSRGFVELQFSHRRTGFWGSASNVGRISRPSPAPMNLPTVNTVEFPALALQAPAEPKLYVECAKYRIAGDLQTGRKWTLGGAGIAAAVLAVAGGIYVLLSRPAGPLDDRVNASAVAAETTTTVNASPQVIEVNAGAESEGTSTALQTGEVAQTFASPSAAMEPSMIPTPEAYSAASAASVAPSSAAPASVSPSAPSPVIRASSGGLPQTLGNALARLHRNIGDSKIVTPRAARTPNSSASEPPIISAEEAAAAPAGPANDAATRAIFGGSRANAGPAPVPEIKVGGQATLPRAISTVSPAYPIAAKSAHIEGDVKIEAEIDPTGKVAGMKMISGPTLLQTAALHALQQWKYEPAKLDGQAVAGKMIVTLRFRLQ